MKKKFIEEPVFESYFWFVWDCSIEELRDWVQKKFNWEIEIEEGSEHLGKTITIEEKDKINWVVWVNDKKNAVSLSHELIHMTFSTLQYIGIQLDKGSEEVFTSLHSCYLRKCLKAL